MAEHSGYPTVGAALRARRETLGLSLEEVATRTRIPRRALSAIEEADYAALPATPYAVGFVKTYARVVGEPDDEAGRAFRIELNANREPRPETQAFEPADPARVPPRWLAIVGLIVAVAAALGYGLWASGRLGPDTPAVRDALAADPAIDQPAPQPMPQRRASPAAAPAVAGGPVVVTATGPAWVRISDGDTRLLMGVMKAGDRFEVPASAAHPVIRTGAAQALRITAGGVSLPPLAPPNTLVKAASLRLADLQARNGAGAGTAAPGASPSDRAPAAPANETSTAD